MYHWNRDWFFEHWPSVWELQQGKIWYVTGEPAEVDYTYYLVPNPSGTLYAHFTVNRL